MRALVESRSTLLWPYFVKSQFRFPILLKYKCRSRLTWPFNLIEKIKKIREAEICSCFFLNIRRVRLGHAAIALAAPRFLWLRKTWAAGL